MKKRLDVLLVERGLAPSREMAQRYIHAGDVRVNGQAGGKPGMTVDENAALEVKSAPPFASRGGEKLEAAFVAFPLDVSGVVCVDIGASTGGFTDCLLQHGAARVYAIDVGYGQMVTRLRDDPRVVMMERTNARYVETLPERIQFVSIDASFISLKILLPVVKGWLTSTGAVVALVKPQFEAGPKDVGKGGVVKDAGVHRRVLEEVISAAQAEGYTLGGLIRSPLTGPKGNTEFLIWLSVDKSVAACDLAEAIERIMTQ